MKVKQSLMRIIMASTLLLFVSVTDAGSPIVPGVKSRVIGDDLGTYDFSYLCDPLKICCLAPVYNPCPFPPGGSCIALVYYACCEPLEDCWYQRQGNKLVVWCGAPFPP